jgi:hypothetical protein
MHTASRFFYFSDSLNLGKLRFTNIPKQLPNSATLTYKIKHREKPRNQAGLHKGEGFYQALR